MADETKKDSLGIKQKDSRHYFFLNPYKDDVFTHCPKCDGRTKIRKFCLLIHIEPKTLLSLNKSTKYCPFCDLIIVRQGELEKILAAACERKSPDIIGNEYFTFGTIERKDWKIGLVGELGQQEAIKCFYPFKNVLRFKVQPTGWYRA